MLPNKTDCGGMRFYMKISTLGPVGTFSDLATRKYLSSIDAGCYDDTNCSSISYFDSITYFDSIKSVLASLQTEADIAIIPVENFSEGFIPQVLDFLVDNELSIIAEILLPIKFSFLSNESNSCNIKKLFVQFVTKGQCSEFIESLSKGDTDIEIVTTESNISSLERLRMDAAESGAIAPLGAFDANEFATIVENVNDFQDNKTRFLVLSKNGIGDKKSDVQYKSSVIVLDDNDRPGLLEGVLSSFSKRGINLTSIISRPTKKEFGKYHFFIDFDGSINESEVESAILEIKSNNKLKFLGSYPKAIIE